MRLLILVPRLGVGGAQRQALLLARGLGRLGHAVTVVSLTPGQALTSELSVPELRVVRLGKSEHPSPRMLSNLLGLIKRESPDVLHSYLPSANIATGLVKRVYPDLPVVWGLRMTDGDGRRYHLLHRLVFWLEHRLPWEPDLMIANAPSVRRAAVAAGLAGDRIVVIPNGFDTDEFRPDPEERNRVRRAWGVGADERLIGMVGRLDPMKGHEVFLQAAARLLADDPGLRFVCVGPDFRDRRSELEQMSQRLGLRDRISWEIATSGMRGAYNAIDILCHPSLFGEGFPNAIAESLLCETPCIATEVGHSRQVLGEDGVLVAPGDAGAIAFAVRDVLRRGDLRSVGGAREARERIAVSFSERALVEETEATLRALFVAHERRGQSSPPPPVLRPRVGG